MRRVDIFLLTILFFAVTFPTACFRDLWEPDEPRFALVAREMVESGDVVMPHRNGKPYPDKPPFYFWTIALASTLTGGVNTAAAVLPTAAAGALTVFLTFLLALRLGSDRKTAWLAALVLATSVKVYWQATHAQIDMVLTALTTMALLGLVRWEREGTDRHLVLAWGAMGLATLAKGPVGLLVPLGSAVVWRWWGRRPVKSLFSSRGMAVFGVIVGSWLVLLIGKSVATGNTDYLQNILFKQTVVRFAKSWHHYHGVTYFFQVLLYDFFPWSPFLLGGVYLLVRRYREQMEASDRMMLAVVGFVLVFFSIPMGKRGLYILPLYPAAAVLVARFLENWSHERVMMYAGRFAGGILFVLGLALLVKWQLPIHGLAAPLPVGWVGLGLVGFGGAALFHRARTVWLPAAMVCLYVFTGFVAFPALNERNSMRPFVEKNMTFLDPASTIAIAQYRSAHVLYGDRRLVEFPAVDESDAIAPFVSYLKTHPNSYGILSWTWVSRLKKMGISVNVLNRRKVGNKDLCFIRIREPVS